MRSTIVICFSTLGLATRTNVATRATSDDAVSSNLFADFQFYAQHVAAVYCNADTPAGQLITCANSGCPLLETNKVTTVASFTGALTGIGGYVSVDNARREVVLSIRGTTNFQNALTDIALFTPCDDVAPGARAHAGFLTAWHEIADRAGAALAAAKKENPGYKVVIAGHSLGAGVATVGTTYLRRDAYAGSDLFTYGSPRVGNDVFADYVNGQSGSEYRVTHYDDATPNVPLLIMGYRHAGPEYWLSTPGERKIDYTPNEVKVCQGKANLGCSGSVAPALSAVPHRYILADLYACGGLAYIT